MKNEVKAVCKSEDANQQRSGVKRIPAFIKRLSRHTLYGNVSGYSKQEIAKYRATINRLCKAEITYMRNQLGDGGDYSVQTLHRYISDYRNGVRDSFNDLQMPVMYNDTRGRKIKTHIAVKYLAMTKKEKTARKQADITAKNAYTDIDTGGRLIVGDAEKLIYTANDLLANSDNPYDLAVALLAVTGRRPIEILHTGHLTACDTNKCTFSGQAKTREATHARDSLDIFTLAPANLVVNALDKLRDIKRFDDLTNRQIESRTSGYMGLVVRKNFGDILEKGDLITPKSLRGIWVNVAHHLFRPMAIDSVFATDQLGHATPNGQKVSNASADNYMQFYVYPFAQDKIQELLTAIA